MGVKWTEEQEQVIQLQNRNILVSAAAGSGKTAVLVERILTKMTRQEHPVDIDKLLIVTFTRAAAGEMKERLMAAVEKRLETEPDNEHLQRQQTLIHNAQITTIDGFCSYVIRNYFHTIDLDPGYRIAEEGELKLLKYDVVKELLEKEYEEATESFQQFTEVFASGKTDDQIVELILKLYEFSMSHPWPKEWLDSCRHVYEITTKEELRQSVWIQKMWTDVRKKLEQALEWNQEFQRLTQETDGPYMYEEAVILDGQYLHNLIQKCEEMDLDGCAALMQGYKFKALSRKKDDTVSPEKREQAKICRDQCKDILSDIKERYFYGDSNRILKELELCREPVQELIRLTEKFSDCFAEKKRKKNIVDFSDIEHFALDILVKKEGDTLVYTPAADEFSDRFEEILIDEYQDSNLVQETLLQSVSKLRFGQHNIFMVGDVKQSIYRFRLARPELFMEKYNTYSKEESECQRIDLHKNFRSRKEVLACVNYLFEQIMTRELGDVEYDADAALYPGAQFPDMPQKEMDEIKSREKTEKQQCDFHTTEVLLVQQDEELLEDEQSDLTAQELEARMIGTRILEIVGKELVLDKATGTYRKVRFQDCVILLRTISGWGDSFVKVLMEMGIPAYSTSKTGYFSALEVVTILNYLHICDNPMQEIPLTGVLLSPIGDCSATDLAKIKAHAQDKKLYDAVWKYCEDGEDAQLQQKLLHFKELYEVIRERVPYTPIHELIQLILRLTGYEQCASAMPGGTQRKANLQMLVEKAIEFEKTSYRGLFNFIRYMEQLQKYQVDFGEVSTIGENDDTVRIMSIHKSKGLEFPIVFVAGMGKRFNMMDANAGLVIHPDLGIGMQGIDPELRVKMPTMLRQVIQKQIRLESLGEELRVLYVALTRAKEKLILTGSISKLEHQIEKILYIGKRKTRKLSYTTLESVQDFWGWILPALVRHPEFSHFWYEEDVSEREEVKEYPFVIKNYSLSELVGDEMERQISQEQHLLEYQNWDAEKIYHESIREQLENRFSYQYPYAYLQEIPAKVSVSELKKGDWEEMEEAQPLVEEIDDEPIVPAFMRQEKEEIKGALRGTAYHRVLECLDYARTDSQEMLAQQLEELVDTGKMEKDMAECVKTSQLLWFVNSRLGQRMKQAALNQKLWREQQFVMSVPANEKNEAWTDSEQMLVQGIIDAFFEEEDGLVLVDYKTDFVLKGHEQELIDKYQKQLWYYARVLERVRTKKVKEIYIYSFALGKSIRLDKEKET